MMIINLGGTGGVVVPTNVTDTNLALATRHCNIDESSGICDSLLGAAFRGLLLLLRLNLYIEIAKCQPNVISISASDIYV